LSAGLGLLARAALFGVGPLDPLALAASVVALGTVVGIASYLPSRRATRVDPVLVLRE
jgi:ABC-type lipoprotein release transport system permease subunit